jgi:7 transmembrane sweet-taste receptor of 3 GCPR/IPT/TIG domain
VCYLFCLRFFLGKKKKTVFCGAFTKSFSFFVDDGLRRRHLHSTLQVCCHSDTCGEWCVSVYLSLCLSLSLLLSVYSIPTMRIHTLKVVLLSLIALSCCIMYVTVASATSVPIPIPASANITVCRPLSSSTSSSSGQASGAYPMKGSIGIEWGSFNLFDPSFVTIYLEQRLQGQATFQELQMIAPAVLNSEQFYMWQPVATGTPGMVAVDAAAFRIRIEPTYITNVSSVSAEFQLATKNFSAPASWPWLLYEPYRNTAQTNLSVVSSQAASPFNTYYLGTRWQSRYLPSDVGLNPDESYVLQSVSFRVGLPPGITVLRNFRIAIAFVPLSSSTASPSTFDTTQVVYGPSDIDTTNINAGDWITFNVSASPTADALVWSPQEILVLEISHLNDGDDYKEKGSIIMVTDSSQRSRQERSDSWQPQDYPFTGGADSSIEPYIPIVKFDGQKNQPGRVGCATNKAQNVTKDFDWSGVTGSSDRRADCVNSKLPQCRQYASLDYYFGQRANDESVKETIAVFGGASYGFDGEVENNDFWVFQDGEWIEEDSSNCSLSSSVRPCCRRQHSSVRVGSFLYIFGGLCGSNVDSDMWRIALDPKLHQGSSKYDKMNSVGAPAVYGHSSVTDEINNVWIIGGVTNNNAIYRSNSVYKYSISHDLWSREWPATVPPAPAGCTGSTDPNVPPCTSQAATAYYNGGIYMFGGLEMTATVVSPLSLRPTNALYRFDVTTKAWKQIQSHNCERSNYPQCRYDSISLVRPYHALAVFAGVLQNTQYDVSNGAPKVESSNDFWEVPLSSIAAGQPSSSAALWFRTSPSTCSARGHPCGAGVSAVQRNGTTIAFGGRTVDLGTSVLFNRLDTYRQVPQITAPPAGMLPQLPTSGGSTITINGNYFGTSASAITVRTISPDGMCSNVRMTVLTQQLTCDIPPGAGNTVQVIVDVLDFYVTWSSASVQLYTYVAPTVTSVYSLAANTLGGNVMNMSGISFGRQNIDTVSVQLVSSVNDLVKGDCTHVEWTGTSSLRCRLPPMAGLATVIVTVDGQSSSAIGIGSGKNQLQYDAPTISAISFEKAGLTTAGGIQMTLLGANFGVSQLPRSAAIANKACTDVAGNHTYLTCVMPEGAGTNQPVTVSVAGSSTPVNSAYSVDFPAPHIDSVHPEIIDVLADVRITLVGSNFGNELHKIEVAVGGIPCGDIAILVPHTQVSCQAPESNRQRELTISMSVDSTPLFASDVVQIQYLYPDIASNVRWAMFILAIICEVILCFFLLLLYKYEDRREVRASSPIFMALVIIGAMISVGSIFELDQRTGATCHLSYMLLLTGFIMLFGALLVKNYRLLRIFSERSLKAVVISNGRLLAYVALFVALELALLFPLAVNSTCGYPDNDFGNILVGANILYFVVMIVAGFIIALKSRIIDMPQFQERVQLGYAIYNIVVCLVVFVPALVLFREQFTAAYALRSIGTMFMTMVTVCVMFGPKFYRVYIGEKFGDEALEEEYEMQRNNTRNATQSTIGAQSARHTKSGRQTIYARRSGSDFGRSGSDFGRSGSGFGSVSDDDFPASRQLSSDSIEAACGSPNPVGAQRSHYITSAAASSGPPPPMLAPHHIQRMSMTRVRDASVDGSNELVTMQANPLLTGAVGGGPTQSSSQFNLHNQAEVAEFAKQSSLPRDFADSDADSDADAGPAPPPIPADEDDYDSKDRNNDGYHTPEYSEDAVSVTVGDFGWDDDDDDVPLPPAPHELAAQRGSHSSQTMPPMPKM